MTLEFQCVIDLIAQKIDYCVIRNTRIKIYIKIQMKRFCELKNARRPSAYP